MTPATPPWKDGKPAPEPEQRRADIEKAKRRTMGEIPPAGIIRKPLNLPPMERVQEW